MREFLTTSDGGLHYTYGDGGDLEAGGRGTLGDRWEFQRYSWRTTRCFGNA